MHKNWIDKNIENKRSQEYQMRLHQEKLQQIANSQSLA